VVVARCRSARSVNWRQYRTGPLRGMLLWPKCPGRFARAKTGSEDCSGTHHVSMYGYLYLALLFRTGGDTVVSQAHFVARFVGFTGSQFRQSGGQRERRSGFG